MSRRRTEPSLDERLALKEKILSGELTIGQSIRAIRKQIGFTQPQFAQLVGIYPRVLLEIENDRGNPTMATLNRILEKLGFQVGIVERNDIRTRKG
jgi:transcriptional regulator with XRE-family HTH domain